MTIRIDEVVDPKVDVTVVVVTAGAMVVLYITNGTPIIRAINTIVATTTNEEAIV